MEPLRRGSISITAHSGPTLAIHTRTQDEEDLPHATKRFVALSDTGLHDPLMVLFRRTMADHLRRFESLCAILYYLWKTTHEVTQIYLNPSPDADDRGGL